MDAVGFAQLDDAFAFDLLDGHVHHADGPFDDMDSGGDHGLSRCHLSSPDAIFAAEVEPRIATPSPAASGNTTHKGVCSPCGNMAAITGNASVKCGDAINPNM